jgi:hypothetical protein
VLQGPGNGQGRLSTGQSGEESKGVGHTGRFEAEWRGPLPPLR